MKLLSIGVLIAVFGWFASAPAEAHDCCHHNQYGDCTDCGHHCYPSQSTRAGTASNGVSPNIQNVEGKIAEVVYLPGATPDSGMVEVRVHTADQTKLVRLAPAGFLKQSGLHLREGDAVVVQGFAVTGMEGDLVVATEVRSGGAALSLRDVQGRPVW